MGRLFAARRRVLAIVAGLSVLAAGAPRASSSEDQRGPGAASLTRAELHEFVEFLTRPEWNGRAPGSPGADSIAHEIEARFRSWGLEGTGPGGSMQVLTSVDTGVRTQGTIGLRDERHGYSFARDYRPLGFSGDGRVLSTLAFVGYGRTGSAARDDFAGIDLEGRIALMLVGEKWDATQPAYPDGSRTPYAAARRARERGAAAVLLVSSRGEEGTPESLWAAPQDRGYANLEVPVMQVTRTAAESLLSGDHLDLDALQRGLEEDGAPRSRDLRQDSVEVLVEARRLDGALSSVVGWKRGRTAETVVIAACYDGYGLVAGGTKGLPAPGANDNASGTAALLALARAWASGLTPERSICFIAYAGRDLEEIGLTTALQQPGLEREHLVAVLDLASLGRPTRHGLLCAGGGDWAVGGLRRANESLPERLTLRMDPEAPPETVPGRLAAEGIPALGISYGRSADAGRVEDRPESLDADAMQQACRLVYGLAVELARAGSTPGR